MIKESNNQAAALDLDLRIFEGTPGMRLVLLPDAPGFTIISASKDLCSFLGLQKEQLTGKSIFETFTSHPADPELTGHSSLENSLEYVLEHKSICHMGRQRYDVAIKGGRFRQVYCNNHSAPVLNDHGEVLYIVHTLENLTDRKKMESTTRKNEMLLQAKVDDRTAALQSFQDALKQQVALTNSILDASFNGIYCVQAVRNEKKEVIDFRYLFVNEVIARFLNMSIEEVVGKTVLELLPETKDNGFFDLFCQVLGSGTAKKDETFFIAKTIHHWFDYSIVPTDMNTLVVTLQDITRQKMVSEEIRAQKELFDSVVSNSTSALLYCQPIRDEKGRIQDFSVVLANEKAAELSGFSDLAEFKSLTIKQIHQRAQTEDITSLYINIVETGKPQAFEYYMSHLGRWYYLSTVKVTDGFLTTCTDISESKSLQVQLENTIKELKHSNDNLEEFAYAASHDLKEPIRKIHFYTDRLKGRLADKLQDEDLHYFERLEMGARRMSTLIDDLLTYSHIGRGVSSNELVDLNRILALVMEDQELAIKEKKAKVFIEPLPVIVGHRRQLQQLFENLVGNALKYSKPGVYPEIRISCSSLKGKEINLPLTEEEREKLFYLIEVQDNGIGFEQDDSERIFNVFTRLHGNAEYRGSGVGLSIVRKVAENHQGYVWAKSKTGEGSTFKVLLPSGI